MERPNFDAELLERLRRLVLRVRGSAVTNTELQGALGPRALNADTIEDIHAWFNERGVNIVED